MKIATLTRRRNSAWDDLFSLHSEMDRLFTDSARALQQGFNRQAGELPALDVLRNNDHFIVRADLPGITRDNIELNVVNNRLFIRGEKKHEKETDEANAHRLERFYGRFERVIELPREVDHENIKASLKDGVLELVAPLREDAKPRRIAVEVK